MRRLARYVLALLILCATVVGQRPAVLQAWWPEGAGAPGDPFPPRSAQRPAPGYSLHPEPLITRPPMAGALRTGSLGAASVAVGSTSWYVEGLPAIGAMLGTITVTLEATERCFAGISGPICSFRPGADYGQLYIRDVSTILLAAQYFYPDEYLRTAIEEFLALQATDETVMSDSTVGPFRPGAGAISGIADTDHLSHKHTVVSDEEPTLVHAAYLYYTIAGGPAWLRRPIAGIPIIERLNRAMDWLFAHRYDAETGLIKRAHTTDWGDVKMEPGQPTQMDPHADTWTASLYDQAWTYRALVELADMNAGVGDSVRMQIAETRATQLRQQARLYLWQAERGYFRTHIHLTPHEHSFDEDAMVSIANAMAVYSGLTEPGEAKTIASVLEQARRAAGSAKPGVVLYPPYPAGTFAYARMQPGQYQNGAQWDWWAGFQIAAEFEHGESALAMTHLLAVAHDWERHPGDVWEWQYADTLIRGGARYYAGAAGTMTQAVVSGLFGVQLSREAFQLVPRLGERNGGIRVRQAAAGRSLVAEYRFDGGSLLLTYSTDHPKRGRIGMRLPEGVAVSSVRLNSQATPYRVITLGGDRLLLVDDAPGNGSHALEVRLR